VSDAQLAALAIEYQAVLHSNDSDFSRFPGLRWHNPLP
jgi:predicted nucleic acid-binding protein